MSATLLDIGLEGQESAVEVLLVLVRLFKLLLA